MICDHALDVGEIPARGREVDRNQFLLAPDPSARIEASNGQERGPAHDRAASDEPEHGSSRQIATRT